jgi:hypothetical protein
MDARGRGRQTCRQKKFELSQGLAHSHMTISPLHNHRDRTPGELTESYAPPPINYGLKEPSASGYASAATG